MVGGISCFRLPLFNSLEGGGSMKRKVFASTTFVCLNHLSNVLAIQRTFTTNDLTPFLFMNSFCLDHNSELKPPAFSLNKHNSLRRWLRIGYGCRLDLATILMYKKQLHPTMPMHLQLQFVPPFHLTCSPCQDASGSIPSSTYFCPVISQQRPAVPTVNVRRNRTSLRRL